MAHPGTAVQQAGVHPCCQLGVDHPLRITQWQHQGVLSGHRAQQVRLEVERIKAEVCFADTLVKRVYPLMWHCRVAESCPLDREAFAEAQAKRPHFGHTPVADVGLYFSSRTRDWVGREKPAEWFLSFLGAHKALVYDHIPYGVALDENATLDSLLRFPVVLVPNAGIVSEREATLFRQYAEAGKALRSTVEGMARSAEGRYADRRRNVLFIASTPPVKGLGWVGMWR